jgi:putative transposase
MVVSGERSHRWIIHDRDSIYSEGVDATLAAIGLTILKTPVRAPQANAFCERLVGSMRRECLDRVILLNERHLRPVLTEWVAHYNHGRPHASLGPGIPDPQNEETCEVALLTHGHRLAAAFRVVAKPVLGGLHHEYRLHSAA